MDIMSKYPFEKFLVDFNFTPLMQVGETIDDASPNTTIKAYDQDGDDVTATLISGVSYSGAQALCYIGGGLRWERYEVVCQVQTKGVATPEKYETHLKVIGWALVTCDEMIQYIKPQPPVTDSILLVNLIAGATSFLERQCGLPDDHHFLETRHEDELYDMQGENLYAGPGTISWPRGLGQIPWLRQHNDLWLRHRPVICVEYLYDDDLIEVREKKWRTAIAYTATDLTMSATQTDYFTFHSQDAAYHKEIEVRAPGGNTLDTHFTTASINTLVSAQNVTHLGWSQGTPSVTEKWRFSEGFHLYWREGHIHYPDGFTQGHQSIRVTYRAGYLNPPFDLALICKKLVAKVYLNRDKEGMQSESIGAYSYSLFSRWLDREDIVALNPYRLLNII